MRDRLIHEYFGVDYFLVWDVVKNKIPDLKEQVNRMLEKEKTNSRGKKMAHLVLATRNEGKVRELTALLMPLGIQVVSLAAYPELPEIPEEGDTFEANALTKARTVAAHTGRLAMADDSGLEVEALNGAPGVHSARFSGEPRDDRRNTVRWPCPHQRNNEKLLRLLEGVPWEKRRARFRCVIALVTPEGTERVIEGTCEGFISCELRGTGGFGYDPLFYLPEFKQTFAELDLDTKNRISHRARALTAARTLVAELLGGIPQA
jgi:XTP/dITP diphosphohydrolase